MNKMLILSNVRWRKMKAITIKQPWASLIAFGEKYNETRSWRTKYRGEIFIHAGKQVDKEAFNMECIKDTLNKHGIYKVEDLPTGCIIAKCKLTDVRQVLSENYHEGVISFTDLSELKGKEIAFGDYSKGRYAWKLEDIIQLKEPIPCKGQLSIWNYEGGDKN